MILKENELNAPAFLMSEAPSDSGIELTSQPNLVGTKNQGETKQERLTNDYIKPSFEASI